MPGENHQDLREVILKLCDKAGYRVLFPKRPNGLCRGMPYHSKGYKAQGQQAAAEPEAALHAACNGGEHPIVCDTSPCTLRLIEELTAPLSIFEPAGFIHHHLLPHLSITQREKQIALHISCSSRRMGLEPILGDLAGHCAEQVFQPEESGC